MSTINKCAVTDHDNLERPRAKVLVLAGPTAVGKTRISLELAERLNGEIISADSVQVYRGLNIGSDKISEADRRGVPHHLIDVLSPEEDFSAGEFYRLARAATEDVLARGRTPIVVGGTGFYLRWFILGKPSTPASTKDGETAASAAIDAAIANAEAAAGAPLGEDERWHAAVALVTSLGDEESAKRILNEKNNWYRLQRVVEILMQSPGRTLAELNLDEAGPMDYDFRCYFLFRPRAELYRRIDRRVEDMVAQGVITETADMLLSRGLRPNVNCATRAIGYRQVLEFLEARQAAEQPVDGESVVQLAKNIQSASRKLCHRQFNWFRDDNLFRWVNATREEPVIVDEILSLWNDPMHVGGCADWGRLTPEQRLEMKRYIAKMELLHPGSKEVARAIEETRTALAAAGGMEERAGKKQKADAGGNDQLPLEKITQNN